MKNLRFLVTTGLFIIMSPMIIGQGYPGHYRIDDSYTRGLLTRLFNVSNELVTFGVYWGDLSNTYYETAIHRNNLRSVTSIDYRTTSPDILVADYQSRIRSLNDQISSITQINKARIDRNVREIGESLATMARRNNLTTGNEFWDWAIKETVITAAQEAEKQKYEREISRIQAEAEAQLCAELKQKMDPIRDAVLEENRTLADEYLKSAAYEPDQTKEEYFLSCSKFHKCFLEEVERNYSIYSTEWMNPNCKKPRMYISTSLLQPDYLDVAYRKKAIFTRNGNTDYLSATKMYLEAALSQDIRNARAYQLMSEMEDDPIEKRFYALMAADINPSDRGLAQYTKGVEQQFTKTFFYAIRDGDTEFVSRVVKRKFHLGQQYMNKTPVEQAIDYDRSAILKIIIDDMHDRSSLISHTGYPLLFHASAMDSPECIRLLKNYGVPLDYADPENNSLTALNIAVKNSSQGSAGYLYSNYTNFDASLSFAKNDSQEDLNLMALFLYNQSGSNLPDIEQYYPGFMEANFGSMTVAAQPTDASIYLNGTLKGNGSVTIKNLPIGKTYEIEVRKNGLQAATGKVQLRSGSITDVQVILQQPASMEISHYSIGDEGYELVEWTAFYKEPENLKRDSKRNREYNDRLIKKANDKAREKANNENKYIREKLVKANNLINTENQRIRERNNQLENGRYFAINYEAAPNSGHQGDVYASNSSADKSASPKTRKMKLEPDNTGTADNYTPVERVFYTEPGPTFTSDPVTSALDKDKKKGNLTIKTAFTPKRNNESVGNQKLNDPIAKLSSNIQNMTEPEIASSDVIPLKNESTERILGYTKYVTGSYMEFSCYPDAKVFPGMLVVVSGERQDMEMELASGIVTSSSGKNWVVELTRVTDLPKQGDQILIAKPVK